jgi:hypothetical protein
MNDPFAQYHGNPLDDIRRIARALAKAKRGLLKATGIATEPDKQDMLRYAAERQVTMMVKQPPSVHRVAQDLSSGRIGETTIEDRGAELTPAGADVSTLDDGTEIPFWDVSKGPSKALVATREGLAGWLAENGLCGLVNSTLEATSGAAIHLLMVDAPTQIGVVVSWYDPITEKDRYNVINPFAQYLKLLGGRAAGAVATPLQGTFGAESAEGLRSGTELVSATIEGVEHSAEMVGEHRSKPKGTGVYLVEFFAVAAMSSDKGRYLNRTWTSNENPAKGTTISLGGNWAWIIPIADIADDILALVDAL